MCGIIGYTGKAEAAPFLLQGLERLSYRGYDSAGMVVQAPLPRLSEEALGNTPPASCASFPELQVCKARGSISALEKKSNHGKALRGTCGLGHTRWATHGSPHEKNAHPHLSRNGQVAVVHNGIIENHRALRSELEDMGYIFASDTDSEVAVHLLDAAYQKQNPTHPLAHEKAITEMAAHLQGSYALGIIFSDAPQVIYALRQGSPLVVGFSQDDKGNKTAAYLASDMPALLPLTRRIQRLTEGVLAKITPHSISFFDISQGVDSLRDVTLIQPPPQEIPWQSDAADRGDHPHFMIKEIWEQPSALSATISPYLGDEGTTLAAMGLEKIARSSPERVIFIGCGSAYHVCATGKLLTESLARIPCEAYLASEFRYTPPVLPRPQATLTVLISQSGETADTLMALRHAQALGMPTLAILNAKDSSMATLADHVLPTRAGPEISVATTKAYTCQLAAVLLLAMALGKARQALDPMLSHELTQGLMALPSQAETLLSQISPTAKSLAKHGKSSLHAFFIGRGLDHPTAMEGSLKLKEISYIHAEAYAAGELKHGSISLIEKGTPVIAVSTQPRLYQKMRSAMAEVKARGASVTCVTNAQGEDLKDLLSLTDHLLPLPQTHPLLSPLLSPLPLQLMAYHTALAKGLDIDQPRNLAKSVTVE